MRLKPASSKKHKRKLGWSFGFYESNSSTILNPTPTVACRCQIWGLKKRKGRYALCKGRHKWFPKIMPMNWNYFCYMQFKKGEILLKLVNEANSQTEEDKKERNGILSQTFLLLWTTKSATASTQILHCPETVRSEKVIHAS